MFKSYEYKYIGQVYDKHDTRSCDYELTIVDDDFIEKVIVNFNYGHRGNLGEALYNCIKIYTKKQLPVVQNLLLVILFFQQKLNCINTTVKITDELFFSELEPYKEEIKKLLLFS